ncbi:aspartyl-tRNA synthetase [Verticillium alfalfae VaMs.102]|uniref:aspartate--tRNA ligase n=1 Tax=Verticillium alfalfae (strain VaMs.102 / ATCC MYA-4576 / FGSC 10136) TaxID=526221 RepID=C9SD60_VERA1|nr:aspartyl-tRNA synthetase [Verticillium alfalfae VaMs.102]EEY17025.1 aspartyl-tRNA synthetase [Verticillium alfalfae VaMs.102]
MTTTSRRSTESPSPGSPNPFLRIAHKLAALRHDHDAKTTSTVSLDRVRKSPRNSSSTTSSSDKVPRLDLRNGVNSAPDVRPSANAAISSTPSTPQSPRSQPRTDDEDPETPEEHNRYGAELHHPAKLVTIAEVSSMPVDSVVTFRARIHTQRRMSKHLDFLLFRDQTHTIQGVLSHTHPNMVRWAQHLNPESIVQVTGTLQKPVQHVRSATHSGVEISIDTMYLVSPAHDLAFSNYKAPSTMHRRLEARVLDLRHPANQALFRVRHTITRTFRESLEKQNFMEMHTPKLQPAATESGASVFKVNYFGRRAFLAQSPQLAKQMAISADFGRVYEIGPVFRAENSNTHRHLTEYTGLDLEMTIQDDYHELIKILDCVLKDIFTAAQAMPELDVVRERWPSSPIEWLEETPIIPFAEGIQMLRDDGRDVEEEDLSTRDEIRLGELVKEKYKTDYYILDKFPKSARPFYTHKAEDPKWTNSFDIFVRGQEICTGGQRINDAAELRASMVDAGISEDDMAEYLTAFDLGIWRHHTGAAVGYVKQGRLAMVIGDPLCDIRQYAEVIPAFIDFTAPIEAWRSTRKGKQVHLTEIRPWVDMSHRRYFAAEKGDQVHGLVVLAQLAPRHGWQVKWALDFPGAPNGTIDVLIETALASITGSVTFGVGAADKLTPGEQLHGTRAKFLAKTYEAIVKSLGLNRKTEFRRKFGVLGEQVYICYPKHDVTLKDLRDVVKFFED